MFLLTIAFHLVLSVGSSPLKFNRYSVMYSFFFWYSELCTGKLRWLTTGTHLQDIILWRGQVKPWWEWALQTSSVDLKLAQDAFSPARSKRNNLLQTSTASEVQWQAEMERSSGCSPIKHQTKIGFPGGEGGGSLCCNSLPDKKQLHLAWEGLLVSQKKKAKYFKLLT